MQISLNVREISPDEATGLIALLVTLFGEDVLPDTTVVTGSPAPLVSDPKAFAAHIHAQDEGTRETTGPVVLQVSEDADGAPFLEPSEVFGACPPAAPAPTAVGAVATPPPPPAHVGGAVELDVDGLPWDARIHASSKAKVANGSWRAKKNLDDATKAAVTAELRQMMGGAPAPAVAPPVEVAPAVVPPPPAAAPVAVAPPAPIAPTPPPAQAPSTADFVAMMGRLTPLQQAHPEKLATPVLAGFTQQLGLTAIADLLKKPEMIPAFEALVNAAIA